MSNHYQQNSEKSILFQPFPADTGLYSSKNEHDACGVGMVANLNNIAQHQIIEMSLTVLKRLMHRGAAGGDPETGDGAGILFSIPDIFFRRVLPISLPEKGRYAVAMIFGAEHAETKIENIVTSEGGRILFWRHVPTLPEFIGSAARKTCPAIKQLFIGGQDFPSQDVFQRKLFIIRRRIEQEIQNTYIASCSNKSIIYKGLLLATQLDQFYPDLLQEDVLSPLAIIHQRYSTNTFPTWKLAHPFRFLAHNGEINTLRGNLNQLRSREPFLEIPSFGEDLKKALPLIDETQNDSACLDNMLELLVLSGRSLPHAMLMLMPQAWGQKYHMGRDVRGFFEYHSTLMEPWDGPAAVAFSDGVNLGAMLDRNGLRPARYTLTKDGIFVLASETGVLDIPPENVMRKGRLRPGEIIWCDLENQRLVYDAEIKNHIARQKPYRRWAEENQIIVNGLFDSVTPSKIKPKLRFRQKLFGWSQEDVELIVREMANTGHEPLGSMGNDAALAVLSEKPQMLFHYFKQLFAQVTNPPIDPIREMLVMSLTTYIGNEGNILKDGPAESDAPVQKKIIKLSRPVLTDEDARRIYAVREANMAATTLSLGWKENLEEALKSLQNAAIHEVISGKNILFLSDQNLLPGEIPMPSLLATSAVHQALIHAGLRPSAGIIVQSGEIREVMHFALLLGYGATAIHPYLALETITSLVQNDDLKLEPSQATENYITAVNHGLLKVISKMGISTLRSYRGAQIFEAVGIHKNVIDTWFPGTTSRIGGITLTNIAQESIARFRNAQADVEFHSQDDTSDHTDDSPHMKEHTLSLLPSGGQYAFRKDGENHLWNPETLRLFRQAVQENDRQKYRQYAKLINDQTGHLCTLRGLFEIVSPEDISLNSIPLENVEPVESILKRFVSGAMSLGSLSPEAHETIAVAMNRLGAASNCGEGGEDPKRNTPGENGEIRASAIRQVASGRFGVTVDYLAGAKEIQIKMAQGAKPGEGGQLPGEKVDDEIARIRHSIPHVTLISPPPHHDIYSIEDLAQLIYDLRCANQDARVSVKLVSEVGVGTVAAGVAKAHADVILISGHDGGTGASPLSSIKHTGLPWELGLAETQQTLVLNKLRGRVRLQVDGQLKTGRDVIIAALLGAEEFGFATTLLVCLGCVMMRKCHENTCPMGVATQDPKLRKCFRGKPEYIENFLRMLAEEVREYLAQLGFHSLEEAVGRSDMLRMSSALDFYKTKNLDFSKIFYRVSGEHIRYAGKKETLKTFDDEFLIPSLQKTLTQGTPEEIFTEIHSVNRTVGTALSSRIVRKFTAAGLPEDTIKVHFRGVAGQSFGAFLAPGVTFFLEGEANDFVGKGISGGKIIVTPPQGYSFVPAENIIAGNVIGYGGTSGKMFFHGQVGERFAIRNSGFSAVTEGVGDHACEYMTGGRIVVLGQTGVNFAAGMTGGIAYVYDVTNDFDLRCNVKTVDLETVNPESEDEQELLALIREHITCTGSVLAKKIIADWKNARGKFVKVIPYEYIQALKKLKIGEKK
ncbi:MAG: glutamate synthase large subunit [Planctomycetia bacterium]|nr:glutamate synthase large subunit [Planctomycetia bacterium]